MLTTRAGAFGRAIAYDDEDSEPVTRGTWIERRDARRELTDRGEDHLDERLLEIRSSLRDLKGLTRRERKILRLRYETGLTLDEAAAKMDISQVLAKRICRSGVRKLRAHFADVGALSADAPIPRDLTPDYAHWHWETLERTC